MRLLITTQIVDRNDPTLGFFHRWVEHFARECESVEVICLKAGEYDLPENVRVTSLGKEDGVSRLTYLARFYRTIWSRRRDYDAVFVHMNPEYVVLGGIVWRCMGKRIGLWYTHRSVNLKLRIATLLSNRIFTASEESFRIATGKKTVVGHGIEVPPAKEHYTLSRPLRIITVGRISPIKRIDTVIDAARSVQDVHGPVSVQVVGAAPDASSASLVATYQNQARQAGVSVTFSGGIPHSEVSALLADSDIFVSASETGSLDKALLEALAVGLPVATSNLGAESALSHIDQGAFVVGGAEALGARMTSILSMETEERHRLGATVRERVIREHSLTVLISRICTLLAD